VLELAWFRLAAAALTAAVNARGRLLRRDPDVADLIRTEMHLRPIGQLFYLPHQRGALRT